MKLLMIVGCANDIFIYNMSKWLKTMMDVNIDIIEYNHQLSSMTYDNRYYDKVDSMSPRYMFEKIPFVRRFTLDWDKGRQLKEMLKGRYYDIIQCHYVMGLYAYASFLKNHCNKLYFTFWGGERKNNKYLGSNRLFIKGMSNILVNYSDGIINASNSLAETWKWKGKRPLVFRGNFGSAPLEALYSLKERESSRESKEAFNIPIDKINVQLGYSGKKIHQYLEIINELNNRNNLKTKVHLLAPMTRGADSSYVDEVERLLKNTGFSYTIIRDKYLTDIEMARLRNSVDVALQLSLYDGYSRSIVECLCAGTLLIYGDWLKYENAFRRDGFEAVSVSSIVSAIDVLDSYVFEKNDFQELLNRNVKVGKGKYLWSECIKDWVAVYNGCAQPMHN